MHICYNAVYQQNVYLTAETSNKSLIRIPESLS